MRGVEIKGGSSGIGKSRFGCEQENSAKKSTLNQKSEQEQEFCKDTVMEDPKPEQEKTIDSSDKFSDGPCFDDLYSPGGQHWSFGTFQNMEVRNISRMEVGETKSVAINEYGTNLHRNKYDSLATFEAKLAMHSGKLENVSEKAEKGKTTCETQGAGEVVTMANEMVHQKDEELVSPSPTTGTQEAPVGDFSSQEDIPADPKQSSDMLDVQKESGNLIANKSEGLKSTDKPEKEVVPKIPEVNIEETEKKGTNEDGFSKPKAGGRHSARIMQQGRGDMKIADAAAMVAKKRNLEGLQKGSSQQAVEEGAEAMQNTALFFHPQEASTAAAGVALLQ
ncbi:unnamed protein product [Urochloa humidicola]